MLPLKIKLIKVEVENNAGSIMSRISQIPRPTSRQELKHIEY